jgi:two-component system phosphate regulon sensor histidine kinase PhoR
VYLPFLLIIIASLATVAWYATSTLTRFHARQTEAGLRERAEMARELLRPLIRRGRYAELQRVSRRLGETASTRITVILPSGRVVADSDEDPAEMDDHGGRPEVAAVLAGKQRGISTRHSATLDKRMMYLALPMELGRKGGVDAVVRASIPYGAVSREVADIYANIVWGGVIVAVLAAVASLWVSHRLNRPIQEMRKGAERFAEGNLGYRLKEGGSEEMATLADTMNRMAAQLGERIREITSQRNELEAVLTGMVEAVFAVDMDGRLIRFNQAAQKLLGLEGSPDLGGEIGTLCPNPDLQRFVSRALTSSEPISGEVVFHNGRDRYLQAQGAKFRDERGVSLGALVVLHDVTRLKRLEEVRRDFVANVSHELKTPIASVKGAAETLRDGALSDPEDAGRFLDIVLRHTDRLAAIVDDLLTLSRIEREEEPEQLDLTRAPILPVLEAAVLAARQKAERKRIEVKVDCPEELTAHMNPHLLEHAVINLLDNAVKYSEPGSAVEIRGVDEEGEARIQVRDTGRGISEADQKRIFERFYRVDKARSRKLGGTGLGLAIVKHIASAHHGRVTVESEPGEGSLFTIHLPAA